MTVARILARKGANVVTTSPRRTLQEVATELIRHGIGALVVLDPEGEIIGLIGERDIVNAIARRGVLALLDEVSRHMSTRPRVVAEDESVDAAMEIMTVGRCRHLPVVRNGRLAGIVSIGDVVKYCIDKIEAERLALREYIMTA